MDKLFNRFFCGTHTLIFDVFILINFFYSLNTLRLWQPQLFATIENFYTLNTTLTNPTFCEILDFSMSINANKTVILDGISNCENVRIITIE